MDHFAEYWTPIGAASLLDVPHSLHDSSHPKTGHVIPDRRRQPPLSFERIPYCELVDSREECPADAWLPDVRLHVFGHIHEAYGAQIITRKPPLKSHPD